MVKTTDRMYMYHSVGSYFDKCNAPINVMPEGGGPRDRVGTLIKNKNLESNFLTLGIRFQFKVPHPGKRF